MKKTLLLVLFLACVFISCEKQQISSKDEQQLKTKTSANDLSSSQEITELPKPEVFKLVYETKDPKNFTTTFSEANGELNGRFLYLLENKKNNKQYLIKSPKQIDFNKDLINKKFVNDLSFTDNLDNTYSCKVLSKKKNQTSARPGVGEPGQLCIDWYWVIFNEQTGEIVAEIYVSTTCYDGAGGTGGSGGGGLTDACNLTEQEADKLMNDFTALNMSTVYYASDGTSTIVGPRVHEPRTPSWPFVRLGLPMNYWVEYTAFFKGVASRPQYSLDFHDWRWESLEYNGYVLSDGGVTPCLSLDMTVNVSTAINKSEPRKASASLTWNANLTFPCSGGIIKFAPKNGSGIADFYAQNK